MMQLLGWHGHVPFACLESRSQAATNKSGSVTNKLTPQQNLLGHLDIFFNVHLKCLKAIPGRPRPSTLAKLSKQAGFPRSRLEHTTRLELSNRLARFGCIQPWYLQYAKMIKQAKNDAKSTRNWHLTAHDPPTFPPILPRNQRCFGLI